MRHERSYLAKESGEVFWRIEVEVLPGKLEEFRATVQDLVASSKQEPGTLVYDWFLRRLSPGAIGHTPSPPSGRSRGEGGPRGGEVGLVF